MDSLIEKLQLLVIDFDGVLTDNKVYIGSDNIESVKCTRADGLAIDALKILNINVLILSSEKNCVVLNRAQKLNVEVLYGIKNKAKALNKYFLNKKINPANVAYIGNDINDIDAMLLCGYKLCPLDSHAKIKKIANVLKCKGGDGVLRYFLEELCLVDLYSLLYKKNNKRIKN